MPLPTSYTPLASEIAAWEINTHDAFGNQRSSRRVKNASTPSVGPLLTTSFDGNSLYPSSVSRQGDKDGIYPPYETASDVRPPLDLQASRRQLCSVADS